MDDVNNSGGKLERRIDGKIEDGSKISDVSWHGYLTNVGTWLGKRALCNARGKVLVDLPSRVSAERFQTPDGEECVLWKTAVQTDKGVDEVDEEWSRPELAQLGALVADGCFSVGPPAFVGERCTIDHCAVFGNLRVRGTFAFDWEGRLTGVVASRERKRSEGNIQRNVESGSGYGSSGLVSVSVRDNDDDDALLESMDLRIIEPVAWRSPSVLLDYSIGVWEGTGVLLDCLNHITRTVSSTAKLTQRANGELVRLSQLAIERGRAARVEARARLDGNTLFFSETNEQVMLLPGGVCISSPPAIRRGMPFSVGLTFLVRPDYRKRVVRYYNRDCEWTHTVFISERRIG